MKVRMLLGLLMVLAVGTVHAESLKEMQDKLVKETDACAGCDDKVKALIKNKLIPLISDETMFKAAVAQNAKGMTQADIDKIDKEWMNAESELPIQKEVIKGAMGDYLRKLEAQVGPVTKTFLMDNQGSLVGSSCVSEDYWQGDEDKFIKSWAKGEGHLFVDKAKVDKSTNSPMQQISLPLVDSTGKMVGALMFGVRTDKL